MIIINLIKEIFDFFFNTEIGAFLLITYAFLVLS